MRIDDFCFLGMRENKSRDIIMNMEVFDFKIDNDMNDGMIER